MDSWRHRSTIAASLLSTALLVCPANLSAAPPILSGVQVFQHGGGTRIVVRLSAEPEVRFDRLSKPRRIFFDFDDTRVRIQGRRHATFTVTSPLAKQIRVAPSKPGVARLVIDLATAVDVHTEFVPRPTRFVIELRKAGVARPVVSKRRPVAPFVLKTRPAAAPVITAPPPPLTAGVTLPPNAVPDPSFPPFRAARPKTVQAKSKPQRATGSAPPSQRAQPAKPASDATDSLTRTLGLKIRRVVLDPGHGGHDQGTAGKGGLKEKDLVLDIARRLGALIEKNLGAEVIYTRSDDRFIPLEQRTRIANQSRADLFLSIHANSSPARSVSGVETYYLSFTTSKTALETAARENASAESSVFELRDLLQKIALKEKVDESREFATAINSALYKVWYTPSTNVRNRGVKKAPFVVLIGANMPSILAEIGFLSNARDESQLRRSDLRQRIAEGLLRGIREYAGSLSHYDVARRESDRRDNE